MDKEKFVTNTDYRYQSVTEGTSPQARIVRAGITKYDERNVFTFPIPNITAMCLDQSYKTWVESQELLTDGKSLKFIKTDTPEGIVTTKEDSIFFDLVQKRMGAIVFACTALESFANESIPDHFIFRGKNQDKKGNTEHTKEQTERLKLETKLYEVLPEIFKLSTPKGQVIGERYKSLEKLRNRIIHMKSKDRISSPVQEENIWKELLNPSSPNVAIEAKKIIGYFLNSLKEEAVPLWYKNFPWEK